MAMDQIAAGENKKETTKIQAAETATINAGAVISVFGIKLLGTVEKDDKGMRILACQPTKDPEQKSVTLESVCKSADVPKDKQNSIDNVIKYFGFTGGIAGTKIDVHQVFYYYSNNEEDAVKFNDKTVNQEYAFSLEIENNPKPSSTGFPFEFESISFSLWNSIRPKLVESMGMYTISEILGKFSNEQ